MSAVLAQDALQPVETDRLLRCELVIEKGMTVFVEVGEALTEIRDGKLYRGTHGTFDTYCRERWKFTSQRAYQIIDQAKVASAIGDATGETPNAFDISARDAAAVKGDLPAVVEQVQARVSAGEAPAAAAAETIKAKRAERAERAEPKNKRTVDAADRAEETSKRRAKQAENDQIRDEARAQLPESVRAVEEFKAAARKKVRAETPEERIDALEAENEELRQANAALTDDVATAKAENERWDAMRVQFEQGGFGKVVEGLNEQIRVLREQVVVESRDKASWAASSKAWRKRALDAGWSSEEVIDLSEGARA